jgi:hypothetical protein
MNAPQARISMLQGSLRCFVSGWLALIPWLGLPFSVGAIFLFFRVRLKSGGESNPARLYLIWGVVLGCAGLLLSVILSVVVVILLIKSILGTSR